MKTTRAPRGARGITYVEVLVLIGIVVLAISILLPSINRLREASGHQRCPSNLRQIGQVLLLYANDHKGVLPMTRYASNGSVAPTWGTGAAATDPWDPNGPATNDVTAALFLVLRTQDITPEIFVCPSTDQSKWDFGGATNTARNWSNFVEWKKHLSYSFQNPYAHDAAVNSGFKWNFNDLKADFAIAADMNPGMRGGANNVTTVTTTSSASNMRAGNSLNHDGDGQNVLYGDGHVSFEQTPFCGVQRDNIYTTRASAGALTGGPIIASPFDATDSILLPTAD
jgi:prepilin-type processing-associated H-X9-DG protein